MNHLAHIESASRSIDEGMERVEKAKTLEKLLLRALEKVRNQKEQGVDQVYEALMELIKIDETAARNSCSPENNQRIRNEVKASFLKNPALRDLLKELEL